MKRISTFSQFLNESFYIETWYKDKNGNEIQMLGSDGTTVLKTMPKTKDINSHSDRIKLLTKIKPFLIGEVTYKVIDKNGKIYKTIHDIIE